MHFSQSNSKSSVSPSGRKKSIHRGTPRPSLHESTDAQRNSSSSPKSRQSREKVESKSVEVERNPKTERRRNDLVPLCPTTDALPSILVWVKNEPFDFGILSPFPCPKIGINILRKIAEYCRDKPGHFPQLSLSQWSHICKYKLQFGNHELCTAYFRVFDILNRPCGSWADEMTHSSKNSHNEFQKEKVEKASSDLGEKESRDEKFYRAVKQAQDPDTKEVFIVPTLQFLLFLYIQHFRRLHKKFMICPTSLKQDNESWPKLWHNLKIKPGSNSSGSNVPEIQHAEFVTAGLSEIIDFLMILYNKPTQANKVASMNKGEGDHFYDLRMEPDEDSIPIEIVKALSFILGAASTTLDKQFSNLEDCLSIPEIASMLEYSRIGRTVNKQPFITWIFEHLKINPWGPSCIPIPHAPVSALSGVYDTDGESFSKNRLFWNTQKFPKAWFLISCVQKQVLYLDTLEPLSSIKIHRCVDCHIYLPGTHHTVLIQKCEGVILNLGVVVKVVKVSDCSNVTLTCCGRLFLLSDVSSSTFYLLTPSSPIFCGHKNREIKLAPYNTTYPDLDNHMRMAGISTKTQRWNKPLEMASDGYPVDDRKGQQSNLTLLSPDNFSMAVFPYSPINSPASTPSLSTLIPGPYLRRTESAYEKVNEAKREFREKMMASVEDTNLIYQITLQRFKKWLKESGNFNQVIGLCSQQKTWQHKSTSPLVCSKGHDLACIPKSMKNFFCSAAGGINLFSEKLKRTQSQSNSTQKYSEGTKYFGLMEDATNIDSVCLTDAHKGKVSSRLS